MAGDPAPDAHQLTHVGTEPRGAPEGVEGSQRPPLAVGGPGLGHLHRCDQQGRLGGGGAHLGHEAVRPDGELLPTGHDEAAHPERPALDLAPVDLPGGGRVDGEGERGAVLEHHLDLPRRRRPVGEDDLDVERAAVVDHDRRQRPGPTAGHVVLQVPELVGSADGRAERGGHRDQRLGGGVVEPAPGVPVGRLDAELGDEPGEPVGRGLGHSDPTRSCASSSTAPRRGISTQLGRLFSS